jgi:membrane protein YqaA with SNARE-associated domain/outer membrane lipoprotein-sorting protein
MSFLTSLSHWLVTTLEPYGAPGLMLIAIADSSFISLPEINDAALMALTISNPSRMWILASMTVLGSVIGCSLLYAVGRKGGEALLQKRFSASKVLRVKAWYQKYGMLAIIVPSLLPPPLPFKIFVLSAGAFQISWLRFVTAVGIGRSIRYFTEGILAVWYGKQAVQMVADNFAYFGVALATLIVAATLIYVVSRRRKANAAALLMLPFLLVLFGSGCVKTVTVPEGQRMFPSFPFDRTRALQRLEQLSEGISSLKASISLEASTAATKETNKRTQAPVVSGTLIVERPHRIWLKGTYLIPVFEMVSDGKNYQVWINKGKGELYEGVEEGPPSKPFTHLGDLGNQFVNLRPKQLQEALLPEVSSLTGTRTVIAASDNIQQDRRNYFVLLFVDVESSAVVQKFWFDQSTEAFDLVRRQTFNASGSLETDTRYSELQPLGTALRFPNKIEIHFLDTDTTLKISVDRSQLVLNGDLDTDTFEFPPRPGVQTFQFEPRELVTQQR